MKASDIDQVLLVGGSSRIPKVQQILQEMFPQTELARRINPDEAIAVGGEFIFLLKKKVLYPCKVESKYIRERRVFQQCRRR
jgi:molecular chaperone DnaK (HSP70)